MEDGRARWQSFYNIFLYLEVQSLALRERNFGKGGNKVTHWHAATMASAAPSQHTGKRNFGKGGNKVTHWHAATMASAAPSQHTGKRKFGKGGNKVTHCKWLQWPQLHPHNIPVKGNLEKEAKRSLIASGYNGLSCTLTTNR